MTLGEKIQKLRKDNSMSQELLAENLNISRQALSKWELGTSVPEVDKIILLSNFFKVSTDYLLKDNLEKGVNSDQNTRLANLTIALITSSAIIVVGLIIGWARGNEGTKLVYLSFSLIAPGLIIQVIGVACFEIFNFMQKNNGDQTLRHLFYGINIWFLAIFPTIFIVGRFFTFVINSYPGFLPDLYMVGVYFIISFVVTLLCFCSYKKIKKEYEQ